LYGEDGEFDIRYGINLEILNQSLYHETADDTVYANLNYNKLTQREKYAKVLNQTQLLFNPFCYEIYPFSYKTSRGYAVGVIAGATRN